jgi:exonuclease III
MYNREVSTLQWYSNYTSNENVVFSEFGWAYVIEYYDYPFDDKDEALLYNGSIYILPTDIDLFPPNNHITENGTNLLREYKKKYNSDVYIIFENDYIIDKGFELIGRLTPEETEQYYTLDYLNKICSSRSKTGIEVPLYWVI